jgi:cytochrome b561
MKAFPPPRRVQVYNPGLRALHWLMAALIFVALPLGVWASQLPRGEPRSEILFVHKSIGVTVLCLVTLRIVWRTIVGAPAYAEPLGRLTHAAAHAAHMALYALMIAMPVTGYMTSGAASTTSRGSVSSTFRTSCPRTRRSRRGRLRRTICSPGDRDRARAASRRSRLACRRQSAIPC